MILNISRKKRHQTMPLFPLFHVTNTNVLSHRAMYGNVQFLIDNLVIIMLFLDGGILAKSTLK